MNLPFLKRNTKPSNKFLTLDIGAEAVNCMAFYVDESGNARILGIGDRKIEPGAVRAGNVVDMEKVEEALAEAIEAATEDMEDKISDVVIGVSGDLALGLITTAKLQRAKHGPVSQQELESVQQKIMDNAYIQARNEYLYHTGNSDTELEPVTIAEVYTKVNNRKVTDPLNAEGDSIEMAIYTAFTPSYHVKNLQKIAKKLKLNILAIGSTMYSVVSSLKYSVPELTDYAIIDMGSDTTDVAVVFGSGIVSTKCLHVGGKHFTEEISMKTGINFPEAEKMKLNYTYENLSGGEASLIRKSLIETLDTWLDGVELLFSDFSGVKTFGPDIVLTGGGVRLPDVFEYISKEPWTKGIPFKEPPEFRKLGMENLKFVSDSTGKATASEYFVPASLAVIYLEMQGYLNDKN
jgi:cell division protein FtsA